jgi:hypothetical protein
MVSASTAQGEFDRAWAITDPRDDLEDDRDAWETMLSLSYDAFQHPNKLWQAVHLARCCGARLRVRGDALVIVAPEGEMEEETYKLCRTVFVEHAPLMQDWLIRVTRMQSKRRKAVS